MKQWPQGGSSSPFYIVFGKKRKFKNVFICIWHAKFKLMGSPRATLRVLNQIFSSIYCIPKRKVLNVFVGLKVVATTPNLQ